DARAGSRRSSQCCGCDRKRGADPMISFELSEEQSQVRDMLSAFATNELAPRAREADETRAAPTHVLDAAWSLGLIGLAIPESYGGGGTPRSALTNAL